MKVSKLIPMLLLIIFSSSTVIGQNGISDTVITLVNENLPLNDAQHPCITPSEYELLEQQCAENIKFLGLDKNLPEKQLLPISVSWPIKAAAGFTDCDYYFIGAYVDQNIAATAIKDFNCGNNTYDGHHGTDISVWPFGFYKMDSSLVEVVAAAPGTIVQKADGNFDRNCVTNTMTANSIIIQHADGSRALYWHMKKNSVTAKAIGQTVVAGEYLGVAGSSGNSSGPHLHFEVWAGSTNTTYNDPFAGTCNTLNTASWWSAQKPHTNPAVIKVSVNTTDIVLPGCPNTETPNESSVYTIPFQGAGLSPGYAKFYIFIRDDVSGQSADCKILNPNGTTFNSWTYTSTTSAKNAIRGYSKLLPTVPGVYTFQATYYGKTCSKTFTIKTVSSGIKSNTSSDFTLYPNPSDGKLYLKLGTSSLSENINEIDFINSAGVETKISNISSDTKVIELNLAPGIYFYIIKSKDNSQTNSGKIIIT